jgi:hypothetical protein
MTDKEELLRKLVVHGHLNVAERRALGTVKRQDVTKLVKSLLLLEGAFPIHGDTGPVFEGVTLSRGSSGIEITWRRAYPWDPCTVAENHTEAFEGIDAAIEKFVETEWGSGIDGINLE